MVHLFKILVTLAAAAMLLPGCTSLRVADLVPINGNSMSELDANAKLLEASYQAQRIKLVNDLNAGAKFNLVNGAALAAASIFKAHKDVTGFFGLTAGAGLATSAMFEPDTQLAAYEAGSVAVSCMRARAQAANRVSNKNTNFSLLSSNADTTAKSAAFTPMRRNLAAVPQATVVLSVPGGAGTTSVNLVLSADQGGEAQMRDALLMELNKAAPLFATAAAMDTQSMVEAYQLRLSKADSAVRAKVRGALKGKEPAALSAELIQKVTDAQKAREDAKEVKAAVSALGRANGVQPQAISEFVNALTDAATLASFEADLDKCIAGL